MRATSPRSLLAAIVAALALACGEATSPGGADELVFPGRSLLLISIDTLRADRLGCYGYDRGTSPVLDALAEESVLFEDMFSNSPKTASSHMSLFTSMLPTVHKVRNQSARLGISTPSLAGNRMTLAQVLNRAGYYNAAVAGGGNINPEMGFVRGFRGRFESVMADVSWHVRRTLERVQEIRAAETPGFVFMHTYQVHGPYLPPPEYMERFAGAPRSALAARVTVYRDLPFQRQWRAMNHGLRGQPPFWEGRESFGPEEADYMSDLYDGEVAYTDAMLGQLLDGLRALDVLDDFVIVVLSDHGEEFGEHGAFEHDQLYRECLHVPCLIRLPGGVLGGTRVTGTAGLVDVMPTLLDLLGLQGPPTMQGRSLVPAMVSGRTDELPVVSERVMFEDDYEASLRTSDVSVVFRANESRLEAFDLASDPGETRDVIDSDPAARRASEALHRALARAFHDREVLDEVDAGGTITVSTPEQLEALAALGYTGQESDVTVEAPAGTPLESWPEP